MADIKSIPGNKDIAAETSPTPSDLLPAYKAARLVFVSAKTLTRWAKAKKLREFKRDGFKARFYSRVELEKFLPKEVK